MQPMDKKSQSLEIDVEAVEEVTSDPEEVPQRKRRHDVILSSGEEF